MRTIKKSWMLLVLSFSLVACMQKPIFTVEVYKTEMPDAVPVEATAPVTLPASPTPFPTPTTPAMPTEFSPILYGKEYDANTFFILLGGVQSGEWLGPDLAAANYGGVMEYDVYTFTRENFQVQGNAPEFSQTSRNYFVTTDITVDEFGLVGVARGWPALQRGVEELSSENEFYRQVVLDWLTAEGVPAPQVDALRVFRVDIEGDGVNEVFVSATHLDDAEQQHTTKSGDYSVILMRKVTGNDAATVSIVGDVYHSQDPAITYPQTYALANFIDLNQDGILEVVVDIQRWEGDGAAIYQINGQNVSMVP